MPRVLHIITGLGVGGAETLLAAMVLHPALSQFSHSIISLLDEGHFGRILRDRGIELSCLHISRKRPSLLSLRALREQIKAASPDLVHCWMYHPALMHGLVCVTLPSTPVVWGLHHSTNDTRTVSKRTLGVVKATRALANFTPDRIVCCSYSTQRHHSEIGFPSRKLQVILNGVDLTVFRKDIAARNRLRAEFGFPENAFVVGHIGRFDPQKDHPTFIRASGMLGRQLPNARFLMCGINVDEDNQILLEEIDRAELRDRFNLLGQRTDIADVMNALDAFVVSSSYGEALPVALLEAMSSEVISIATDVGDCRAVIGDDTRVVPIGHADLLFEAMLRVASASPAAQRGMREAGVTRIREMYTIESMVRQYAELYEGLIRSSATGSGNHF